MPKLRLLKLDHNRYNITDRYNDEFLLWESHHRALHEDCKQYVSGELRFLSHELRLLIWHGSPLKSLPANFHPKNLVYLDMPDCHLEQLWEGSQPLKNLKGINLSRSQYLRKLPDLTEATNLMRVNLVGCISLPEVHPSISVLRHLVCLNLKGCKKLKSLPSSIHMNSLKLLVLSGCSNLEEFPEISGDMNDLSSLNLEETAIKELPSSIEFLQGLATLKMSNCRSLVCLPDNICKLACLENLYLDGCSKLSNLPENLGDLENLSDLRVKGSGIQQLPFSILRLQTTLSCEGCKEMTTPFSSWSIQENPSYSVLVHLDLSDCNLLELSDGIAHLSSLESLNLRRNNKLESLPAAMNRLVRLTLLGLDGCNRLKLIPELSSSIQIIDANDCTALKTISTPKPPYSEKFFNCFLFYNCFQLVQTNLFTDIVETATNNQAYYPGPLFVSLPAGSDIPDWFNHQCRGSSLTVQLPPNKFLGLAICAISNLRGADNSTALESALCWCTFKANDGDDEESFHFPLVDYIGSTNRLLGSDHMFLRYKRYNILREWQNEGKYTEARFRIVTTRARFMPDPMTSLEDCSWITSCGVRLFLVNNEDSLCGPLQFGAREREKTLERERE